MFQLLSPKMEQPPGYFPMRPNRGTMGKKYQSCPQDLKRMSYYPAFTPDQSAHRKTLNPYLRHLMILADIICNLHAIGGFELLSIGFLVSWIVPLIIKYPIFPTAILSV